MREHRTTTSPSLVAIIAIATVLLGMRNHASAAEVFMNNEKCFPVAIRGEIDQETPELLLSVFSRPKCAVRKEYMISFRVYFDSPGGDVDAAMQVGRMLRRWKAGASVGKNPGQEGQCASACVLALLGGVTRQCDGAVGLHRPYSLEVARSAADAARSYRSTRAKIERYLQEMNIPPRLLDVMNSIGPDSVRWLSCDDDRKELDELWITGVDPVWDDLFLSNQAKELHISKTELIRRRQEAHASCPAGAERQKCRDRIIGGGATAPPSSGPSVAPSQIQGPLVAQAEDISRRDAEFQVEQAHPHWTHLVKTADFEEWYSHQPENVQRLGDSPRPEDAIQLLDLYKRDRCWRCGY